MILLVFPNCLNNLYKLVIIKLNFLCGEETAESLGHYSVGSLVSHLIKSTSPAAVLQLFY